MSNKFITQILGIKEKYIEIDHYEIVDSAFHVELSTKVRKVTCPRCKHKTKRVHSYRTQRIQGRLIEEKPVILSLRKRRYKCLECHATFMNLWGWWIAINVAQILLITKNLLIHLKILLRWLIECVD